MSAIPHDTRRGWLKNGAHESAGCRSCGVCSRRTRPDEHFQVAIPLGPRRCRSLTPCVEPVGRHRQPLTQLPDGVVRLLRLDPRKLHTWSFAACGRCCCTEPRLPVLRFPFPERRWREHVDAPKRIQDQEILITGDDGGALAGQCGRQHDIVVAVATRWGIECVRRHERERLGEQLKGGPHINSPLAELPLQNLTELVQQGLRRNDDVLADAVFEEFAAGAARDEGGYQHVRINRSFTRRA